MESRYSSPPEHISSVPRPKAHRNRSNSLPIVEALGCSTPEARLILAESTAAVRRRRPSSGRHHHHHHPRKSSHHGETTTFRPEDHMRYLSSDTAVMDGPVNGPTTWEDSRPWSHSRIPSTASNCTDRSASTIKGPTTATTNTSDLPTSSSASPGSSPLGDYSANLAQFIKSQLNSIPSYNTPPPAAPYAKSCPDLSRKASLAQSSPVKPQRRPVDMPPVEIPPMRPPLKSAFSEWSTTTDESDTDNDNDASDEAVNELLPVPSVKDPLRQDGSGRSYHPPSILNYDSSSSSSSILFSSPPLNSREGRSSAPPRPPTLVPTSQPSMEPSSPWETDCASSSTQLSKYTSASVPSVSSTSSYFDYKQASSHQRSTVVASVKQPQPQRQKTKILYAISPFEGAALTKVHAIRVDSSNRVCVEGMTFDLVGDVQMRGAHAAASRVPTPC